MTFYSMLKNKLSFLNVLAVFVFFILAIRANMEIDVTWDNIAYHLPFAALRVGIIDPANLKLTAFLQACYETFPSGLYVIKGYIWKLTGRPNAIQLVQYLTIVSIVYYSAKQLKISTALNFIALLTIPYFLMGITLGNPDAIGAAFVYGQIVILFKILEERKIALKTLIVFGIFATLGSATKYHSLIISVLCAGLMLLLAIYYKFSRKVVAIAVIILVLALIPCIDNFIQFGNPLAPIKLPFFSSKFDMLGSNATIYDSPKYLAEYSKPVRWLLSFLEYQAFDGRYMPYSWGMSDLPITSRSDQMGGYFSAYILICFSLLSVCLYQLKNKRISISYAVLITVLALPMLFTPGANFLRYHMWFPMVLVSLAIFKIQQTDKQFINNENQIISTNLLFSIVTICCFLYINLITSFKYTIDFNRSNYNNFVLSALSIKTINKGNKFCYAGEAGEIRFAFVRAIVFPDTINYMMRTEEECINFLSTQ